MKKILCTILLDDTNLIIKPEEDNIFFSLTKVPVLKNDILKACQKALYKSWYNDDQAIFSREEKFLTGDFIITTNGRTYKKTKHGQPVHFENGIGYWGDGDLITPTKIKSIEEARKLYNKKGINFLEEW